MPVYNCIVRFINCFEAGRIE